MKEACGRPLDRFPLVRTRSVEQLREARWRLYPDHDLDLCGRAEGLHAWMNHISLECTDIWYARYGAAIVLSAPHFEYFVQGFVLRGNGEHVVDGESICVTSDASCVISPGAEFTLKYSPNLEHLVLRINPAALTKKLGALIGMPPTIPLNFEVATSFHHAETQGLRRLFLRFVDELGESGMPPVASAELEQALMVCFLTGNRNNFSHLLDRAPAITAPWQVRRAEEYIEANWDQPITVEALAVATNASARSIFHCFRESRGYSPMVFVKKLRLTHARKMLACPVAGTSVTDVAFACGFGNLGHFAKAYFSAFGERPSQTLNSAKGAGALRCG
jgi:AraC-like DNA-binding protein